MSNTGCQDLILDSPGCMAIARLMLEILDVKPVDRLYEPGKCGICKRSLKHAWSVVHKETFEEWDVLTGSKKAGELKLGNYDDVRFMATPYCYCPHVLDRWATLEDAEEFQLTSSYQGRDRQLLKRFLDTRRKVSPVDVAYALQEKRAFDAKQAFAPQKGKRKAPMDNLR